MPANTDHPESPGFTTSNLTLIKTELLPYFVGSANGGEWVHNAGACNLPDPYNGDPFPGMSTRQGLHSPLKAPNTPYHNFPPQAPGKSWLNPSDLPPGKSIEDVLEDSWNNPLPGTMNPNNGNFYAAPGYPLNSNGDTIMQMRSGSNGVHGWPVP